MAATDPFRDFVKRQQERAAEGSEVDWNKERDYWLDRLHELYDSIKKYLSEYTSEGSITIYESTKVLNEEYIGTYTVTRLRLRIGTQDISFDPVGTLLIGSKGRVDVQGRAGSSRLVLVGKEIYEARQMIRVTVSEGPPQAKTEPRTNKIDWTWKIVSRTPSLRFIDFNKDSFLVMLLEVSNG